ncbi:hypothetical protein KOW79_003848 [Hemibagrus wyckioides]|uniref:Uncharacterized protein n=1 Tax=Hemibagrus wyckioides TaxID=337641 RepID=A0A9D3SU52_9TELE|nr:hypothetical protein KOW79_003848 [Hemibagrus wyckioides]
MTPEAGGTGTRQLIPISSERFMCCEKSSLRMHRTGAPLSPFERATGQGILHVLDCTVPLISRQSHRKEEELWARANDAGTKD